VKTTAVALAIGAVLVAGCGGSPSGSSTMEKEAEAQSAPASATGAPVRSGTVTIHDFMFSPAVVVVQPGGSLRFADADGAAHTATADDRSFDTQTIDRGKSATVTFTRAGRIPYHCDFHPFMKGVVVVR
jgi:plastocyanin